MSILQKLRRRLLPAHQTPPFAVSSFAQEGEDRLLERFLGAQKSGFYVDVGAYHPHRFSTTYALYCKGWRGINIDPTPGMKRLFDPARPGDINLEIAIGCGDAALLASDDGRPLYRFEEEALNTMDEERRAFLESVGIAPRETLAVPCRTLAGVLDDHVPAGRTVDVLNVDVEGCDLDVLQSNDWERFRPRWVLVEVLEARTLTRLLAAPVARYLGALGYDAVAKTFNTALFER